VEAPQLLMVRPEHDNVHKFTALENTCFMDICIPSTIDVLERRKSYFKIKMEGK
jgi:hypothetical protein